MSIKGLVFCLFLIVVFPGAYAHEGDVASQERAVKNGNNP